MRLPLLFVMNRIVDLLIRIYFALVGVLCLVVLGYSVLTRVVWRQAVQNDLFDVVPENIPLLIICVIAILFALYYLWHHALRGRAASALPRMNSRVDIGKAKATSADRAWCLYVVLAFAIVISLFCVFSVRGIAVNDGGFLDDCINAFMEGDYSSLYGGYLATYPFQIGYVMFGQLLYLLSGPSNYLVYQLLNIASILLTVWFLYGITYEISERRDYADLAALLSLGALCLYAYATLVYNDIWSLAPQMAAVYLTMRYLRTGTRRSMAGGIGCLALACVLKSNCYIALVAIVLSLLLAGIREMTGWQESGEAAKGKRLDWCALARKAAWAMLAILLTLGAVRAVNAGYAAAAGLDEMPGGVPSTAYFAMGMQQIEDEGCVKNGWYDGANVGFLNDADGDSARASELAMADIREHLAEFRENPKYFVKFYLYKYLQQWGDGTCSSMRQMEMTGRNVEPRSAAAESLMYGTLREVFAWTMNVFHTVYYLGTVLYFISVFRRRRRISTNEAFLVMYILGGMIFHELWEASSRYVLRYYLCMIPLAAVGYGGLLKKDAAS